MTCIRCGLPIPDERAEFLLETGKDQACINCTREQPKTCFLDYSHKTAPSLVVVGTDPESIRLARRAFKRQR